MRKREKVADLIAGQNGRQHRKQLFRSLEDTAACGFRGHPGHHSDLIPAGIPR